MPFAWAVSPLKSLVVARLHSPGLQVAGRVVRASADPITAHGGDPENSLLRRSSHGPLSMDVQHVCSTPYSREPADTGLAVSRLGHREPHSPQRMPSRHV